MIRFLTKLLMLLVFFGLTLTFPQGLMAQGTEWPKEIQAPKGSILIYQPQPESFKGNQVTARSAVSVTFKDNPEPIFGAAWYEATVTTDRDKRTVQYQDIKVTKVKFSDATEAQEKKFKDFVSQKLNELTMDGSLDRLLTSLKLADKEDKLSEQLNNDPPKIFFSQLPAVLVLIDGKPELKTAEGSEIQQVVNTAFQIFFDPANKLYYLKGESLWFVTSNLTGDWKVSKQVPEAVNSLGSDVDSTVASSTESGPPKIFLSTQPAELIQIDGVPEWVDISGTDLSYVKNSETDIFKQQSSKTYYTLLSGRWFETQPAVEKSNQAGLWSKLVNTLQVAVLKLPQQDIAMEKVMAGPWTYVSPDKLPQDFQKISPDMGPRMSGVLASIPGTDEAKDAVMDAEIPQTAVIDKKKAKFSPTYDGKPDFKDVGGTSMEYAVNTPDQIIKEGDKYYACYQGVWYVADTPEGPYQVSDTRPKNINQLPPDNPNYNTKYVYIYDTTPNTVHTGYTAGYVGSFILGTALGATLRWGTGYYYPGYYGRYYYPRPWSYGYRAYYNPYTGGWGYRGPHGGAWYRPNNNWHGNGYWGPGGYNQVNVNQVNINRNQVNNNIYNSKKNINRNVDRNQLGQVERNRLDKIGNRGSGAGRELSQVQRNKPNNVFADKNGNIYRKDKNGQWDERTGNKWSKTSRPEGAQDLKSRSKDREPGKATKKGSDRTQAKSQAQKRTGTSKDKQVKRASPATAQRPATKPAAQRSSSFDRTQMERQSHARQRGDTRAQNHQSHVSRSRGGGGGGRSHGGGGRRR